MSGPLTPTWVQPSHPDVQQVIISATADPTSFSTKSISKVSLPPFGLFAKLDFPPCTPASEPTYATVQMGRDEHLNLNSDLLYINHSCDPSLIFDMANRAVIAGPKGLRPCDELTFFYPSTEWHMAQPFDCNCGTANCRGRISGAKDMSPSQLEGLWLNGHIRQLLAEKEEKKHANGHHHHHHSSNGINGGHNHQSSNGIGNGNGNGNAVENNNNNQQQVGGLLDQTTLVALRNALAQAEKMVEAARLALDAYVDSVRVVDDDDDHDGGLRRRGPTSRELSGEMGGDTVLA